MTTGSKNHFDKKMIEISSFSEEKEAKRLLILRRFSEIGLPPGNAGLARTILLRRLSAQARPA
jgi:hypothetical protein